MPWVVKDEFGSPLKQTLSPWDDCIGQYLLCCPYPRQPGTVYQKRETALRILERTKAYARETRLADAWGISLWRVVKQKATR
jgi:hypothetical protein